MEDIMGIMPVKLLVHVTTGDRKDADTNATVKAKVYDSVGVSTEELKLSKFGREDLKRGQTDSFPVPSKDVPRVFGEVSKIEFWRDDFGIAPGWYLDLITVEDLAAHKNYYFPVHRWIDAHTHYVISLYDTSLPQTHHEPHQRRIELESKKQVYQYVMNAPGLPVQVKTLPEDEKFSDSYQFDITAQALKFRADRNLIVLQSGVDPHWSSLKELRESYKLSMEQPIGAMANYWPSDNWFGAQRVQGCNPVLIQLCKEVPSNFALEKQRVEAILGGINLDAALHANRIFIVDLKIMEGVPTKSGKTLTAPIALFYLDNDKNLLPLAIQLFQQPSATNPVFYPTDDPTTWTLAKMWYNVADASYHQSNTHLGFTHLIMEGVAVCTNRNLSPSHPIFKLMAPHFLYILAINTLAVQTLINPGGWVDKEMSTGTAGMFELIARRVKTWRLDKDAIPAEDCAARKVLDRDIFPNYPYRDDAIAIFDAIEEYVSAVVNHFYETPDNITKDFELQSWAAELVKDKASGGVGVQGVPGNGHFTNVKQIVTTVSSIIFTCSVAHAAANFNQYDEYGFPPNYPLMLNGHAPSQRTGFKEEDIVTYLPTKTETLDTMVVVHLLSTKATQSLGHFEVKYLYDPVSVGAATHFCERLKRISEGIKKRNKQHGNKFPYPWLDPEFIPNAISI